MRAAGYSVHGDPADLAPVTGGAGELPPDQPLPPRENPSVLADYFVARAGGRKRRIERVLRRPAGS